MVSFENWGIKIRRFPDFNYHAVWSNLVTTRFGNGVALELPPDKAEFYDIGIGNKCETGKCDFCYVSANPRGEYFKDICETWKRFISRFNTEIKDGITYTDAPFQVAIGSISEPLEHPEFEEFLKVIFESGVVPNYTTNGVILGNYNNPNSKWYNKAHSIIEATRNYVGGVAVSLGNPVLRPIAEKAIEILLEKGETKVNIHHIIFDKKSVEDFIDISKKYPGILYHVLLPLKKSGRSNKEIESGIFNYLETRILEENIENIAFGANFSEDLKNSKIKTWLYPPESLSKNLILDKIIKINPSSFKTSEILMEI